RRVLFRSGGGGDDALPVGFLEDDFDGHLDRGVLAVRIRAHDFQLTGVMNRLQSVEGGFGADVGPGLGDDRILRAKTKGERERGKQKGEGTEHGGHGLWGLVEITPTRWWREVWN